LKVAVTPRLKITGVATYFLLCGCASTLDEDGALATVPYEINENKGIVVEARVNDQGPFAFTLDTAASISVIFDELSSKLSLEPVSENVVVIHGLVASGEFPLRNVDQLSVGSEVWIDPVIAAMPGEAVARTGIDGILGVDFLRRYAVGFSIEDRVIRLYPPARLDGRSYRGWTAIPLEVLYVGDTRTALYFFEIDVGGVKMPAIFDLGAGLNMMNWSAASSFGLDPVELRDDDQVAGTLPRIACSSRPQCVRQRTPVANKPKQCKPGMRPGENTIFHICGSRLRRVFWPGIDSPARPGKR